MGASERTGSPDTNLAGADVNRRYFVHLVESLQADAETGLRVLDFGCGAGEVVRLLRQVGVECYGADTFYEGAAYQDPALASLMDQRVVREIPEDGRLPFDDRYFDLVISDQVLEHVENLDAVLAELDRVLREHGVMHHHFPSREVLREGHIGIPLAHRFRPGRTRFAYTLALRWLRLGSHKEGRSRAEWTRWKLAWIDRYCFYRPYCEIRTAFERRGVLTHTEIDYCRFRAAGRPVLSGLLQIGPLTGSYQQVFRHLAFMAIEVSKAGREPTLADRQPTGLG